MFMNDVELRREQHQDFFAQFAVALQFIGWYLYHCYWAESLHKQAVKFNWTTWQIYC